VSSMFNRHTNVSVLCVCVCVCTHFLGLPLHLAPALSHTVVRVHSLKQTGQSSKIQREAEN
jgi:hypothetical protein